ncbi:MAG TPA: ABC transporter permease, partial [Candidatus Didemnitutus sp.]|nr:ABC transporter permease [Candidatus Didemnitutus sp.]
MIADLRLALRSLLKSPGLFATAALALALGIGANTAMFSFFNTLILQPLPYPQQERLMFFGEWSKQVQNMSVAYPNFLDWRERQTVFASLGVFRGQNFNYVGQTETERVSGAMLSHDLLPTVGMPPILGRFFSADEDKPGAVRTVILSERFWQRAFHGGASALGAQITLSGEIYTVIGVMPQAFEFPNATCELWVPVGLFADGYKDRGSHPGLYALGRLKPGETFATANTAMKVIADQLAKEYPDSNAGNSINMQSLADRATGFMRSGVYVGLVAAFAVLLIACANVANLLLSRALQRQREFAVRSALGASRGRLIRQLLAERALLGFISCLAGLVASQWLIAGMRTLVPPNTPRLAYIELDGMAVAYSFALAIGTSLLFGLIPAVTASRLNLTEVLAQGGRGGTGSGRWRTGLIVGEFALTLVLLFCASLMIRSMQKMYSADTGFSRERILTYSWVMPGRAYEDKALRVRLLDNALAKLAALPGVEHAALTNPLPMSGGGNQNGFYVEGAPVPPPGQLASTEYNMASPDYFTTMGIPLTAGRNFTPQDKTGAPSVIIIDTQFAEQHFKGRNPIGARIMFGHPGMVTAEKPATWYEIVGIVAHVQNYSLGTETRVQCYVPYTQAAPASVTFTLKTSVDPSSVLGAARQAMREVDPALPVFSVRSMREVFDGNAGYQRAMLIVLGSFSGLALCLASIGLYGVLSYMVGQRTREIGVRMAIGATPGSVLGLVLRSGLKLAVVGLALGIVASLGVARMMTSLLYEVTAFDPVSLIATSLFLLAVGL